MVLMLAYYQRYEIENYVKRFASRGVVASWHSKPQHQPQLPRLLSCVPYYCACASLHRESPLELSLSEHHQIS